MERALLGATSKHGSMGELGGSTAAQDGQRVDADAVSGDWGAVGSPTAAHVGAPKARLEKLFVGFLERSSTPDFGGQLSTKPCCKVRSQIALFLGKIPAPSQTLPSTQLVLRWCENATPDHAVLRCSSGFADFSTEGADPKSGSAGKLGRFHSLLTDLQINC